MLLEMVTASPWFSEFVLFDDELCMILVPSGKVELYTPVFEVSNGLANDKIKQSVYFIVIKMNSPI